jgi:alpha-beta hydrolase superfamily lysophospholipase
VNHQDRFFRGIRDAKIYYQAWLPDGEPKAALLIVHGLAEHSGRYTNVVKHFVPRGYAAYGLDLIGHGRSDGARAFVRDFAEYTGTVGTYLGMVRGWQPEMPIFLLGHSLGALIGACCFLDYPSSLAGAVLSGTSVQMPDNITPAIVLIAKALSTLAPKIKVQAIESEWVSRDPDVVRVYKDDPLVYTGGITARTGVELLKAQQRAMAEASRITLPILMVHGGDDRLTPLAGARAFYETIGSADKTLKVYGGLYHEVYNEPEREQVLSDVEAWLEAHI